MTKIYDIWIRAVVESEKAKNTPGLNAEVFPNIQFVRFVDQNPKQFSEDEWKEYLQELFQKDWLKTPEQPPEKEQKVSVACRQVDGELYRGEVKLPSEYTGENPEFSISDIYA